MIAPPNQRLGTNEVGPPNGGGVRGTRARGHPGRDQQRGGGAFTVRSDVLTALDGRGPGVPVGIENTSDADEPAIVGRPGKASPRSSVR